MHKYKVGDVVKLLTSGDLNEICKIVYLCKTFYGHTAYLVERANGCHLHICEESIKLSEPESKYKVGDVVTLSEPYPDIKFTIKYISRRHNVFMYVCETGIFPFEYCYLVHEHSIKATLGT